MTDTPHTEPSSATEAAEEDEACAEHVAGRGPTAEEDKAAPGSAQPGVAEHYKDAVEKGADVKGEGEVP